MKKLHTIAILYTPPTRRALTGKFSETDEDTVLSAKEIQRALISFASTISLVPLDEDNIVPTIQSIRADCIVNLIDWTGLDLPLSLLAMEALEKTGIPFTGVSKEVFLMGTDKLVMKTAFDTLQIPTPKWQAFVTGMETLRSDFHYPLIVKLSKEHCSIGLDKLSFVKNQSELLPAVRSKLKTFDQPVIAEEFITGREFQVTLLETKKGLVMLPPAEVVYKNSHTTFLTFESRWNEAHRDYHASTMRIASLTKGELNLFHRVSFDTFKKMGFFDFTRLDMRMRGGELLLLEANANPGLSDEDEYGMTLSYKAVGMTFGEFVFAIIESALRRFSNNSMS